MSRVEDSDEIRLPRDSAGLRVEAHIVCRSRELPLSAASLMFGHIPTASQAITEYLGATEARLALLFDEKYCAPGRWRLEPSKGADGD